jgi:hypothetical protein
MASGTAHPAPSCTASCRQRPPKDEDGQISKDELTTHVEKIFDNMDQDSSGGVSRLEWLFAGHKSDQH